MINWLLGLADTKASGIARLLGRKPEEVKGALEQLKKVVPEIQNSPDKGRSLLDKYGIDDKFAKDMHARFRGYADRIPVPGIGEMIDNYMQKITNNPNSLRPGGESGATKAPPPRPGTFDKNKYPKVD